MGHLAGPYTASPSRGWRMLAIWTRIWWVRPVSSLHSTWVYCLNRFRTVMGYGILAVLVVDAHFLALHRMAANGSVHSPLILRNNAMYNGLVPAGNGMFFELGGNGAVCHIILTCNDDPVVSISIRCTIPGRMTPLMPDSWSCNGT